MIPGSIYFTNSAPAPDNSGYTYVLDSTKWNSEPLAKAAARTAPGKSRGFLHGKRVSGFYKPTGQAVTLTFLILTDVDGTANTAWEVDTNGPGGGTIAVASGTAQPFDWLPHASDFAIEVLAGATAPTAQDSAIHLTDDRSAGT